MLPQVVLPGFEHFIGHVPHGAADSDGRGIPQEPPDLSGDHGHTVGGEPDGKLLRIKVVDGLDEADAADLE